MSDKLKPWDFLKSLTTSKKDLSEHERFHKDYSPFIINRFLSMTSDIECITYSMYLSDKQMDKVSHYKFLFYSLSKKYRKFSYVKTKKDIDKDVLKNVQMCYNVSDEKCAEIINLLTEEQISEITKSRGGKV